MAQQAFSRRRFLQSVSAAAVGAAVGSQVLGSVARAEDKASLFKISLAEWSLHRTLFGNKLTNLEFPKAAKEQFGITAVEYVNQFFKDKAKDTKYLNDLLKRSQDEGVANVLIMIDGEGNLGDKDDAARTKAVENHYQWVDAAKLLGCHAIRVNAATVNDYEEGLKLATDGLQRLSEFANKQGISVCVENHGGLSSNGKWLAAVMKAVDRKNFGSLPDFGNFHEYDRYQGTTELMPFAKGVSAKSHDFDADGNETHTDFRKMLKIVLDAGYHGYVGVEWEGGSLSESEGIIKTKALLEKVRTELR